MKRLLLNMKYLLLMSAFLVAACQSSPRLEEGRWTGTLTPMYHPDMANPMNYDVSYSGNLLVIQIIGPDSSMIPARNPHVQNDTLYFSFDEPEEQVPLDCAFGETENGGFAGRCTDSTGKWAQFTMEPPA